MRATLTAAMVIAMAMLAACEKKPETAPAKTDGGGLEGAAGRIGDAASRAGERVQEGFERLRDEAAAKLGPKVDEAERDAAALRDRVADAPETERPAAESAMEEVERQIDAAKAQFERLKQAGADTWSTASAELSGTLDRLRTAMDDLRARVQPK